MDIDRVKILQDQIEKLELKIDAMCKAFGVELSYTPQCYEVYKTGKEEKED